jgi:pimeloyl-ACP methyl ester carboxylesterase
MPILCKGDLSVDYLDDGAGTSVVLLHSSVSGNKQWRRLVEVLRPTYRCVAPNLLGYGLTSPWSAGRKQTLADAAEGALALCETIPGPIRLVGHSWGGAVALAVSNKLGAKVSHLALYEPMLAGLLHGHGRAEAWSEAMEIYAAVQSLGDAQDWDALAEIFTDYFNGDGSWASTPTERQRIVASQLPPNRHEWDAGCQSTTAQESFGGVSARTLILRGSLTPRVTREITDVLCEAFPPWRLREVEGAGHMGPLTHSAFVNAEIQSFLAGGP